MTEMQAASDHPIDDAGIPACIGEVVAAFLEPTRLDDALRRAAVAIVERLDLALVRIWTLGAEHEGLQLIASAGSAALTAPSDPIDLAESGIGAIAREGRPHVVDAALMGPGTAGAAWARRQGILAFAGLPLIAETRRLGVAALYARRPWAPGVRDGFPALANALALGIMQRHAEHALREQSEMLDVGQRTGQILAAELDLTRLVQALTDAATEIAGARFGAFFYNVLDERGGSYMVYAIAGLPQAVFARRPLPRATDLFGPAFGSDGTVRIADASTDGRYGPQSPYHALPADEVKLTSYLAVPVVSRSGEVLGGLFFGHPEADAFTARTVRMVETLAAQAAVAIDNVRLYEAQRRALAHAEDASRLKDLFLATVSHELRTPLNAVLGWTYLMRTSQMSADEMTRALETVERNARAQNQLIDDLLDVSSIISGKLRLDVRSVSPVTVVEAALETVHLSAEAKNVELVVALDPAAGPVKGDPDRLQQVVWNLLSNAIKFTPKDGRVCVDLERGDSHIEIRVRDTGVGIKPEFLPFVFDRFRQQEATSRRPYGGLGLGLAIARHLVELHGGTVKADSPGPDHGATFTITLPLAPSADAPPERAARAVAPVLPSLAGVRALVVDDELSARQVATAILRRGGAEVLTAASVEEAMQMLGTLRPDVLVSDIEMPGEDGYSLIERVRRLDAAAGGEIPAVALTAYSRVQDRLRALSAGYQIHVPKPVEPVELLTVVASLTGRIRPVT